MGVSPRSPLSRKGLPIMEAFSGGGDLAFETLASFIKVRLN
jgi:hypothetical protein